MFMNYWRKDKMNLMFDLETLGNTYGVIVQIGACYFTNSIHETFLVNVSIKSCLERGLRVDASNLKFWFEHQPTWLKNTIQITKALEEFRKFCALHPCPVWSHQYDISVLSSVCEHLQIKMPFPYRQWRDINTLLYLTNFKPPKSPKSHNALDDAQRQATTIAPLLTQYLQT